jgi:hypothetical protein
MHKIQQYLNIINEEGTGEHAEMIRTNKGLNVEGSLRRINLKDQYQKFADKLGLNSDSSPENQLNVINTFKTWFKGFYKDIWEKLGNVPNADGDSSKGFDMLLGQDDDFDIVLTGDGLSSSGKGDVVIIPDAK